MEAQLILNNFYVYKTLCIEVKSLKKKKRKKKMLKTESRMFLFSCSYAIMMSLVTPQLFSAFKFKGEYPIFLSDMNF